MDDECFVSYEGFENLIKRLKDREFTTYLTPEQIQRLKPEPIEPGEYQIAIDKLRSKTEYRL